MYIYNTLVFHCLAWCWKARHAALLLLATPFLVLICTYSSTGSTTRGSARRLATGHSASDRDSSGTDASGYTSKLLRQLAAHRAKWNCGYNAENGVDINKDWATVSPALVRHHELKSSATGPVQEGQHQPKISKGAGQAKRVNSERRAAGTVAWRSERKRLVGLMKAHSRLQASQRLTDYSGGQKARAVIFSCRYGGFCGGLADRLHGSITLFYIALMTNRSLFIDWTKPTNVENFYETRRSGRGVDWRLSSLSDGALKRQLESAKRQYIQRQQDTDDCAQLVRLARDPNAPSVLRITTNHAKSCVQRILLKEMGFRRGTVDDAMGLAFRFLFRESPDLTRQVDTFIQQSGWNPDDGLCLHIRHGGRMGAVMTERNIEGIRHHDIGQFWSCAASVQEKWQADGRAHSKRCVPPAPPWLLITDDDDLLGNASRSLPEPATVIGTQRLGPVVHIDKLEHYGVQRKSRMPVTHPHLSQAALRERVLRGERRAFVDHALLRRCHTIVASHSAFSLTAASISVVLKDLRLVTRARRPQDTLGPSCESVSPYDYW